MAFVLKIYELLCPVMSVRENRLRALHLYRVGAYWKCTLGLYPRPTKPQLYFTRQQSDL
jgi:hypothetical protein